MELINDYNEVNERLSDFKGFNAFVHIYNPTFQRLIVKISLPDIEKTAYLMGVHCISINGNFTWRVSDIKITFESNVKTTIIRDEYFELKTKGGIILLIGEEAEFGNSLESLIPKSFWEKSDPDGASIK